MKKTLFPIYVLVASLILYAGAFAESHSKSISFQTPTQVNGTTLQPGTYTVKYDENGSTAQVNFMKGKKEMASAPAQVEELGKKTTNTSVVLSNKTSVPTLQEVDFEGTSQRLRFSKASGTQGAGE